MKKFRVLLTGSSGRLGSVISEDLSDIWDIVPVSRTGVAGKVKCDFLVRKEREDLLKEDFDMVVNAAAISSPSACADNPLNCWIKNTMLPLMLSGYCRDKGLPLVHFSTDLVYSGGNPPYNESSSAVPISFYGWTKLIADILVQRAYFRTLIIRTSVLCGDTPSERTTFSQDILSGKINKVYVDSWRNHTPIHWLAGILPELVSTGQTGLVIASGRYSQSRSAFAEALLEKYGKSTEHLVHTYAPPCTPSKLYLNGRYHTSSINL